MKFIRRPGYILVLILFALLVVSCDSEANGAEVDPSAGQPDLTTLDTFDDIQVGFTEDGYPFRGSPDAPVTVVEWSDYLCPFCGRYTNNTAPVLLDEYVRTGKVRFVFRDFPIDALHPTAHFGHTAALCIGEQGAGLYWRYHDLLYARQEEWNQLGDPSDFLSGVAEEIGADMSAYTDCVDSGRKVDVVAKSVEASRALGFNATPSFQMIPTGTEEVYPFVGAQPTETFTEWFDAMLSGGLPPIEATPAPLQPPDWLTAESLAPDPNHEGYTIHGDPYKGNPDARVIIVEYSDFECPACKTHALETQPTLDEELISTGEIMWVAKNLPLKEHPKAIVAATAAECAGEQGNYWEMHHLLFENQDEWVDSSNEAIFEDLASQLSLDLDSFIICFNSRQALEKVVSDMYDAQGLIGKTPTFVFVIDGKPTAYEGTLSPDQFVELIGNLSQ